jgi:hypothetical protein
MKPSHSYDFLWLSLALLPLVGVSFLLAIQPQDYWWLVRVGQDTARQGSFLTVDTMSLSRLGEPTVFQPWLAGVLAWLAYQAGGATATLLVRGLVILLAYGLIWGMIRRVSNPYLATILILVLGAATLNNWSVRAQLFVYPLFVLSVWCLLQWQNGNQRGLWLLPFIVLLWANLHGSYILPLALAGLALVAGAGEKKPLLIAFCAMLFATLVNPLGFGLWRYFVFMLDAPSVQNFVTEWDAPSNNGWQMNLFFGWLLLFAPLAAFSKRKLSPLEWMWFLAFGWLALTGLRFMIWFLFLLAIFSASLLAEWAGKMTIPAVKRPWLNVALGVLILLLTLICLPGIRERLISDSIPVYEMNTTPLAATDWLAQRPNLQGPLWADYAFSSYLDFAYQDIYPWMDSRFHDFPPEQWTEYVQVSRAENWQEMFDREKFNLLMLSTAAQPKLIEAVSSSEIWCEEYRDEYAVIFSRCGGTP